MCLLLRVRSKIYRVRWKVANPERILTTELTGIRNLIARHRQFPRKPVSVFRRPMLCPHIDPTTPSNVGTGFMSPQTRSACSQLRAVTYPTNFSLPSSRLVRNSFTALQFSQQHLYRRVRDNVHNFNQTVRRYPCKLSLRYPISPILVRLSPRAFRAEFQRSWLNCPNRIFRPDVVIDCIRA